MNATKWAESDSGKEHRYGAARATNEDGAFCILSFGSDDTDFCIGAIVAATRYAGARGPITIAETNENRAPLAELQKTGAVKVGPYLSDSREMVVIAAINHNHMQ